jgi:hypothetical protein
VRPSSPPLDFVDFELVYQFVLDVRYGGVIGDLVRPCDGCSV